MQNQIESSNSKIILEPPNLFSSGARTHSARLGSMSSSGHLNAYYNYAPSCVSISGDVLRRITGCFRLGLPSSESRRSLTKHAHMEASYRLRLLGSSRWRPSLSLYMNGQVCVHKQY